MFHVLDHANLVYTGELSQTTQYVIEHYGRKLDESIRCGIRIVYGDPLRGLNQSQESVAGTTVPVLPNPAQGGTLD